MNVTAREFCFHEQEQGVQFPPSHLAHHTLETVRRRIEMTRELPQFLRDMLARPPRAGEGVHNWLFRVARQLHPHLPAGEIVALLETRVATCGRHVPPNEIVAAVQNSIGCAWQPRSRAVPVQSASKWPVMKQEQREAIIREGGGLADLWEFSPIRIEDNRPRTEEIIDRLFPPDSLLCCGKSSSDFDTRPREDWRGQLAKQQFIVASPMSAVTGLTKDKRESKHTLANTGPRRFLVVEFDTGPTDAHAALMIHLAGYAPLVCAVHSGGKSLHGWFYVQGQPDEKVLKFFRYAVSLGADSRLWTRSQFCRMPDGVRDNGNRQTVFFLSFKPVEATR
jgi:hypothetical protein